MDLDTLQQPILAKTGHENHQIVGIPFDANNVARNIIGAAVGKIPLAGELASKIILLLWPENEQDPWPKIEERARQLIGKMINETRLELLQKELQGLQKVVHKLSQAKRPDQRTKLENALDIFEDRSPQFFDSKDPIATLPLLVEMASLHLVFLKARCDAGTYVDGSPVSQEDLKDWQQDLHEHIEEYREQVFTAWNAAHKRRMEMIKVADTHFPRQRFQLTDGFDGKTYVYESGDTGKSVGYGVNARHAYLVNRWELDTTEKYLLPALSWGLLDPVKPVKSWTDGHEPLRYWLLDVVHNDPYNDRAYNPGALTLSPEKGRIESIDVWHGHTIEAIQVKYAGSKELVPKDHGLDAARIKKEGIIKTTFRVPPKSYVKSLTAGIWDKLVSLRVDYSNGGSEEITSRFAAGLTDHQRKNRLQIQTAQFPDFGVSSFDIGDQCCALYVRLLPATTLAK